MPGRSLPNYSPHDHWPAPNATDACPRPGGPELGRLHRRRLQWLIARCIRGNACASQLWRVLLSFAEVLSNAGAPQDIITFCLPIKESCDGGLRVLQSLWGSRGGRCQQTEVPLCWRSRLIQQCQGSPRPVAQGQEPKGSQTFSGDARAIGLIAPGTVWGAPYRRAKGLASSVFLSIRARHVTTAR